MFYFLIAKPDHARGAEIRPALICGIAYSEHSSKPLDNESIQTKISVRYFEGLTLIRRAFVITKSILCGKRPFKTVKQFVLSSIQVCYTQGLL